MDLSNAYLQLPVHPKSQQDDVIIGGKDFEECMSNVQLVLGKLNKYNIRINVDKYVFFKPNVEFLGHNQVEPLKDKFEAITKAKIPKNVTELKAYLGLLNYYSKFLPQLSTELHQLY